MTDLPTEQPVWVTVLLDWQNIYRCAREAFGLEDGPATNGTVDPLKMANQLAGGMDSPPGHPCKLQEARIYRGRPNSAKDRRSYDAFQSQTAAWAKAGRDNLVGCYRDLRYRGEEVVEKGIDVWLAIDLVSIAHEQSADRVVVVSSDTDLVPALELATKIRGEGFVEVAGWDGPRQSAAILNVEGVSQRRLGQVDYERMRDPTDYNLSLRVRRKQADGTWGSQIAAEGKRPRGR
jgi:uncharacterized LabA/DUF88 family protein